MSLVLLVERQEIVFGLDLPLGLELSHQLLLLGARLPDRCLRHLVSLVGSSHPLQALELLIGVDVIVVLLLLLLLWLLDL